MCSDTDWVVNLSDIHPDGTFITLTWGRLRARYRKSLEEPNLMQPNSIYKFTIEFSGICHCFMTNHKICLSIMSSDFPNYARNQNTGNPIATDTGVQIATNVIYHENEHPSKIILPILKRDL